MKKYFWYSAEIGEQSDDFENLEQCKRAAEEVVRDFPQAEVCVYSYDSEEFPDGNVEIDECSYLGYFSTKE